MSSAVAHRTRAGASGSLQELDHVPIVASVTKRASTLATPDAVAPGLDAALRAARTPHRGPTFVDVPLDGWGPTDAGAPEPADASAFAGSAPDPSDIAAVADLVGSASRPVLMVGGDVYWAGAEAEVRAFAEAARIPVFANDMGRGVVPADHELAFARARATAFKGTDLVLVAGTPLDFRLGFGSFDAPVVHLVDSDAVLARHVELGASTVGDLRATFAALVDGVGAASEHVDACRPRRVGRDPPRRRARAPRHREGPTHVGCIADRSGPGLRRAAEPVGARRDRDR